MENGLKRGKDGKWCLQCSRKRKMFAWTSVVVVDVESFGGVLSMLRK